MLDQVSRFLEESFTFYQLSHPHLRPKVYPSRNREKITGFYVSSIQWFEVIEHSFPREVNGIDCVIETSTKSFTYRIVNGEAVYMYVFEHRNNTVHHASDFSLLLSSPWPARYGMRSAEGDWHDPAHTHHEKSVQLTQSEKFGRGSTMYTLKLYPSSTFFEAYSTSNPRVATIGAVLIIAFTSFLFFLYDFFVQKEFLHNQHLLEAKRRFMRFVSHEVRTPLNAIVMVRTSCALCNMRSMGTCSHLSHLKRE